VGDDDASWGFDGMRVQKWGHSHNEPFGGLWEEGDVLGLAADLSLEEGAAGPGSLSLSLSLSVNGSFAQPNGVAFEGIAAKWLSPALSSQGGGYRVNFGDKAFQHSPPDDGYMSVQDAAGKTD
jgi:hypothetical protein